MDYVFNTYEALGKAELGLLDVTTDGPKYVLLLHTKAGKSIDIAPAFLKEFVVANNEFMGVKYIEYSAPADEPEDDGDYEEEGPGKRNERPRNAFGSGLSRFYVASLPTGVAISNFETSIRETIQRLATGDYSESLSGREEFKEWTASRSKHDLSLFLIGRELQNAVERVLPSKDQSGVDAPRIYREADDWLQLREYKFIVFDLDYDEKARGVTLAASFKTRRQTRLLDKLAIEPAEFKLLKYVPASAVMTAGMQLGDAKTTFNNLKELGYDAEGWFNELGRAGGADREEVPPMPPEAPEDVEPKTIKPGNEADILRRLLRGQDGEEQPERRSEIDKGLEEFNEMLKGYGTSLDELLGVLGTEVVAFMSLDAERAGASHRRSMDAMFETGNMGIAVALKDSEKARSILATAREKDSKGGLRGFVEKDRNGIKINVSPEHPFGWAFTDNALLITAVMGMDDVDASAAVTASLGAMLDAGKATGTTSPFSRKSSKFLEMNFGEIAKLEAKLAEQDAHKLDRYAMPQLESTATSMMTEMRFAVRTREHKDGVEIALQVAGLPDLWHYVTGDASLVGMGTGSVRRNAYSYSESNLRAVSEALQARAGEGKPLNLDEIVKANEVRGAALQLPFDKRWKGELKHLGWITLDQIVRDDEGNLSDWVDKDAAAMIEANEKAAFKSIKLAEGDIAAWLTDWKAGFIVAYQEQPDTLGGHMLIYADGQVGWLSAQAFKDALKLNAEGKPVPAEDGWSGGSDGGSKPPTKEEGPKERLPEGDPWLPGGK
jgi:hypothetical protein